MVREVDAIYRGRKISITKDFELNRATAICRERKILITKWF